MKISKFVSAVALVAAGALGTSASAAVLTLDGGWSEFFFDDTGSHWDDTFEFTIAGPAYLQVTDAFKAGDQFDVYVDGSFLGATSVPTALGDQISDDYLAAFLDPRWSSGEWAFSAGTYEIAGTALLSPFGGGRGGIQLSSTSLLPDTPGVIPLPAGGLMLLSALGIGGIAARRRKKR